MLLFSFAGYDDDDPQRRPASDWSRFTSLSDSCYRRWRLHQAWATHHANNRCEANKPTLVKDSRVGKLYEDTVFANALALIVCFQEEKRPSQL